MSAPKGNRFWKLGPQPGRTPKFTSSEELWAKCIEYFEWVEANPLVEEKIFSYQGEIRKGSINKMRAMTLSGLCLTLGIRKDTWNEYRQRQEFSDVCERVDEIIREQKFTGAAADLLNASIIARDLGLRDTSELQHTGKDGGPILTQPIKEISDEELVAIISTEVKRVAVTSSECSNGTATKKTRAKQPRRLC